MNAKEQIVMLETVKMSIQGIFVMPMVFEMVIFYFSVVRF
jgi:hypothetical protein